MRRAAGGRCVLIAVALCASACGSDAPNPASVAAIRAALRADPPRMTVDSGTVCDADSPSDYADFRKGTYARVPGVTISPPFIGHEKYKWGGSTLARPPYLKEQCRRVTWAPSAHVVASDPVNPWGTVVLGTYDLERVDPERPGMYGSVTPFYARYVPNAIGKILRPTFPDWDSTAIISVDGGMVTASLQT